MKYSTFIVTAIFVGGIAFTGDARAAALDLYDPSDAASTPIDPRPIMIDFRTSDWSSANNASSFILQDVNKNTVGEDDGYFDIWVTPNRNTLWQSWDDGFGVRGGEEDEIDGTETLKIEFFEANSSTLHYSVPLYGVYLTDLFDNTNDGDTPYDETAKVQIELSNGLLLDYLFSSDNDLKANPNNNGEYYGAFGTASDPTYLVNSVLFQSSGNYPTNDEYSVAGFRAWPVTPIPLPAALPLYGTGLAIMGLIGWRKRRKAAST